MTNTAELELLIKKSGLKKGYIAKALGISRQALAKKIKNESVFTATEIAILCDLLKITSLVVRDRVFFAQKVI